MRLIVLYKSMRKMVRDLDCDARVRWERESLQDYHKEVPSRHHLEVLVAVVVGPIQGKVGRFEELFMRVLPRHVQLIEARFCELFDEHAVPRNHLFLSETGVENKGIILEVKLGAISHVVKAWYLDQDDVPSLLPTCDEQCTCQQQQ